MAGDGRPFGELFAEPTRNGLTRPKAVRGDGVKMVNMGELFAHPRLCNAQMDRVPLSQSERERFLLKDGDLLFARQSLVLEGAGRCSIFLRDDEAVTFESHVTRVRLDPTKADPSFYFYYLQSHHGRAAIRSIVEQGAGASGIRGSDLESLHVLWRPLKEQRAIAHILGTLDDKIELNQRMNETLEAMARALFKSWFVDFDPVRAKAEGRDPGLPKPLADLLPARLVDCELGEIPEGWVVAALGDLSDVEKGLSYKGEGLVDSGGMPMVNLGCFGRDGAFKLGNMKRYVGQYRERHLVRTGDLVIANTDVTQNRVILGSPALLPESEGDQQFLFTHHVFALRFKPGAERWRRYLYFTLLQPGFREIAEGFATGTTVLALPRDGLLKYSVILPAEPLRLVFERQIEAELSASEVGRKQMTTLAALRDTLLPKLISGELRVKDAENFIGRAV